jgi:hypothetical protein
LLYHHRQGIKQLALHVIELAVANFLLAGFTCRLASFAAYPLGNAAEHRLSEIGGGQGVGIEAVVRIGFARDIVDGCAQCVESRKALRLRHSGLPAIGKRRSLDEEPYFEHAVMAEEANRVARFVEAVSRAGKTNAMVSTPLR